MDNHFYPWLSNLNLQRKLRYAHIISEVVSDYEYKTTIFAMGRIRIPNF